MKQFFTWNPTRSVGENLRLYVCVATIELRNRHTAQMLDRNVRFWQVWLTPRARVLRKVVHRVAPERYGVALQAERARRAGVRRVARLQRCDPYWKWRSHIGAGVVLLPLVLAMSRRMEHRGMDA